MKCVKKYHMFHSMSIYVSYIINITKANILQKTCQWKVNKSTNDETNNSTEIYYAISEHIQCIKTFIMLKLFATTTQISHANTLA